MTPSLEEHQSSHDDDDDDEEEEEDVVENRSNEDCHCNIHEVDVDVDASWKRMEVVPMIRSSTKMMMMMMEDGGDDDGDHSIANDDWEEVAEAVEDILNPHPHLPDVDEDGDDDCNYDEVGQLQQQHHHRHDESVDQQLHWEEVVVVVVVVHDNTVVVQKDAVDGDDDVVNDVAALAKFLDLTVVDHEAPLPPVDECEYWVDDDCWDWKGVAADVVEMMMLGSRRRLRCSCHCSCCCCCCCCCCCYCCCKMLATMMKMTRIATAKIPSCCCWMEDDDDVLLLPLQ